MKADHESEAHEMEQPMRTQVHKPGRSVRKGLKAKPHGGNGSAHVAKMETRLEQYGARLDRLVAKAKEAGAEAKTDYRKRIQDLKAKYRAAQSRLDELRAAGSGKWDTVKAGVESAWAELEAAFKRLRS